MKRATTTRAQRLRPTVRLVVSLLAWSAPAAFVGSAFAANLAIEDIRVVSRGRVSTADFIFSCPVSYLSHAPSVGSELRVRLALGPECQTALGRGLRSELYDPPAAKAIGIRQVIFDTADEPDARIVIDLDRVVGLAVSQGATRNSIRVELNGNVEVTDQFSPDNRVVQTSPAPAPPAPSAADTPDEPPPAAPAAEASESAPPPAAPVRRPMRLVQQPVERSERFVIQLATGSDLDQRASALNAQDRSTDVLYVNERNVGNRQWRELRLGFFDTEQQARARLVGLRAAFPQSVIAVADVEEQDRAAAEPLVSVAARAAADDAGSEAAAPPLTIERISALLAEANEAMLSANYDRSIQIYSRLLEEPAFAQAGEARERLGIARERKGHLAHAKREYETYLAESPTGPDAQRVRQRLAGLTASATPPQETLASARASESVWEVWGGMAQYFRRDVLQPLEDRPDTTVQSALLSNLDLALRRHGERFELLGRVDAGYQYNLLEESETADPRDQLYVYNAYLNVSDQQHDWAARVGRQAVYKAGVLGRFDGAHVNYQWRPDIALNLTLGRPLDYPRHSLDGHRQFVSVSADLDRLVREWDFSFFTIVQEVDGIADRKAAGAEARYRGDDWNVVAAVDVDLSYEVLNSALVSANWRVTDKLTLNGRVNAGAAPFLTTRNALIGQSVAAVADLLDTYTESQVRTLARNRTAQARDVALGLSWPVFDRFQLNVDVSHSEFDATVASAGVAAMPSSGRQTFFSASLIGSSVIKDGDTAIFTLRRSNTRGATSDTFIFDFRLPTTTRLRLNPRLALSSRTYLGDHSEQWIAAPMLRLAYRSARQHQLEVELGGQWSNREFRTLVPSALTQPEETAAYFVNVGYWWEF